MYQKKCVTEQMLLEQCLTLDPDYICMTEMKGSEAFEILEAARTGHAVISTIHAPAEFNLRIPQKLSGGDEN